MTGMLWFDNNMKHNSITSILNATAYYADKYGERPNTCHMNADMLPGDTNEIDGVALKEDPEVIDNHLWIGVEPIE